MWAPRPMRAAAIPARPHPATHPTCTTGQMASPHPILALLRDPYLLAAQLHVCPWTRREAYRHIYWVRVVGTARAKCDLPAGHKSIPVVSLSNPGEVSVAPGPLARMTMGGISFKAERKRSWRPSAGQSSDAAIRAGLTALSLQLNSNVGFVLFSSNVTVIIMIKPWHIIITLTYNYNLDL